MDIMVYSGTQKMSNLDPLQSSTCALAFKCPQRECLDSQRIKLLHTVGLQPRFYFIQVLNITKISSRKPCMPSKWVKLSLCIVWDV